MADPQARALFAELEDAPPLLMAKGNLSLLDNQAVAIVGVQRIGCSMPLRPRPRTRFRRQKARCTSGLAPAEMPPGTKSRARHFPYRNRIIAGMSSGTFVVEAAPRTGSLITSRLAAEVGRDLMAVSGSPLDPPARGCNQLIGDGATLVQNAADVVEAIRPFESQVRASREPYHGHKALGLVEGLLGPSPAPVDEIIRLSGASSGAIQMALLELELAGCLDRHAGGKFSFRPA